MAQHPMEDYYLSYNYYSLVVPYPRPGKDHSSSSHLPDDEIHDSNNFYDNHDEDDDDPAHYYNGERHVDYPYLCHQTSTSE